MPPAQRAMSLLIAFCLGTLGVIVATPLLAHAYLGQYTRPMADDFCMAAVSQAEGFLASLRFWYFGWSGRFSHLSLVGVTDLLGFGAVPALPALVLAAWSSALAWTLLCAPWEGR